MSGISIAPSLGRLFIKKIKAPEQVNGIYLTTESSKEKAAKGLLLAVGACEKDKNYDFKIDQIVFFSTWAGTIVHTDSDGNEFIVIKMDEVLGVEE